MEIQKSTRYYYSSLASFRKLEMLVRKHVEIGSLTFEKFRLDADTAMGVSGDSMSDYTRFLLDDASLISREQLVTNIIFLLYRDCYLAQTERLRFSEHYGNINSQKDSEYEYLRKSFEQHIKYMKERKNADFTRLKFSFDYLTSVVTPQKREGDIRPYYYLSKQDKRASDEYSPTSRKLKIIDLLVDGKILDKRNIQSETVANAYQELFNYIEQSNQLQDTRKWLDALIDISFIESSCMPVFLFAVARYMDTHAKDPSVAKYLKRDAFEKIPRSLAILCSVINIGKGVIQGRFLHDRNRFIRDFFFGDDIEEVENASIIYSGLRDLLIIHGLSFSRAKKDQEISQILESVCTDLADDAYSYFHDRYNILADYHDLNFGNQEIWSLRLVRILRTAVEELTYDGALYAATHPRKKK